MLKVEATPSTVAVMTLSVVGEALDVPLDPAYEVAFWPATSAEDARAKKAVLIDPMRAITALPVWSTKLKSESCLEAASESFKGVIAVANRKTRYKKKAANRYRRPRLRLIYHREAIAVDFDSTVVLNNFIE